MLSLLFLPNEHKLEFIKENTVYILIKNGVKDARNFQMMVFFSFAIPVYHVLPVRLFMSLLRFDLFLPSWQ